jgi:hypothetical protein
MKFLINFLNFILLITAYIIKLFSPPAPLFCHPEPFFIAPSPFLSPRALFCHPEPFFVTPSGSEGSLGSCLLQDDKVGCTPCHSEALAPFCHSEALAEEPPPGDAVPNEVRDARLALGRTKNEGSARQSRAETLRNLLKNSATPVYSYTIQAKSKLIIANSMPVKLYELFPLILN